MLWIWPLSLLPVGCVALGKSLDPLSLHFFNCIVGGSKAEPGPGFSFPGELVDNPPGVGDAVGLEEL